MTRQIQAALIAFSLPLALAPSAWAQFQQQQQGFGQSNGMVIGSNTGGSGGNTSQGMFGTRTTGNGIRSNGSATSFGNAGQNSGAFGQTTGTQGANGQQQPGAQVQGNERFTRQGRQPGAFVGADASDTVSLLSQMQSANGGQNGMQGLQGLGNNQFGNNQFGNQQGQNQFGNQQNLNNQNNRPRVRTGLRPSPELRLEVAQKISNPATVARVQTRLAKTPNFQKLGSVQLAVEGRTAVLRGTVASTHARDLAERVALLEPGISDVRNELTVDSGESTLPAKN